MKRLWDLTRGIANIVNTLLGRMSKLEQDVKTQERRLTQMEEQSGSSIHSMEVKQLEKLEREEARQDRLSDNELREELKIKYGTTKWAKNLITSILFGRRRKNESEH